MSRNVVDVFASFVVCEEQQLFGPDWIDVGPLHFRNGGRGLICAQDMSSYLANLCSSYLITKEGGILELIQNEGHFSGRHHLGEPTLQIINIRRVPAK